MSYQYFRIYTDDWDAKAWAKKMWDTYGFDWDPAETHSNVIVAWPLDQSAEELAAKLTADNIKFSTFEGDV